MQTWIGLLLTCSLVMSVLSLAYMAALPFLAKRYTAKSLYWGWVVLAAGWIIPFRPSIGVQLPVPGRLSLLISPLSGPGTDFTGGGLETSLAAAEGAGGGAALGMWQVIGAIWLAGTVFFVVFHGVRHWRFMRLVNRWSEDVRDERTAGLFQALKDELEIKNPVRLKICPGIATPMLAGLVRPSVLLPASRLENPELSLILKHELIHFQRRDIWVKTGVLLAAALHWFNPVVYLMSRSLAVQCELACDEQVIGNTDFAGRRRYAEAVISVIRGRSRAGTSLSTSFYGGKKGVRSRLMAIMDTRKRKAAIGTISLVLLAAIAGISLLAAAMGNATVKGHEALAANIYKQEQFVFEGIPWFAGQAEVKEQSGLDGNAEELEDRLVADGTLFPGLSSIEQKTVYIFSGDQLVSGEYIFRSADKEVFNVFGAELAASLEKRLPEPASHNLALLKQAGDAPAGGSSVQWQAADGSRLTVALFVQEAAGGGGEYMVQVKSSAPLEPPQSLGP